MVTLVLHLARTFVTAACKRPRELTWIGGVLLFPRGQPQPQVTEVIVPIGRPVVERADVRLGP